MSTDLTILPVLGASGFAKSIPVGTSADAGDAFGQMLLGVQNAASVGDPAAAQAGLAGIGATGAVAVDGTVAQPQASPFDGLASTKGFSGNQVTSFDPTAAGATLTSLPPGVVGMANGALGPIALATGRQVDAKPVVAGVVGAPQARADAPQAAGAAMISGGGAVVPVADQPVAVAGVVTGRPVAGSGGVDEHPAGSKHAKAAAARDGVAGGPGAGAHEPVVPLAAALQHEPVPVAVVPGPHASEPSVGDGGSGSVPASESSGYAASPAMGPTAPGLMPGMEVIRENLGEGAGLLRKLPAGETGLGAAAPAAAGAGAASAVQGPPPGGARITPNAGDGNGTSRSAGVAELVQPVPMAGTGPGGGVAGKADASAAVADASVGMAGSAAAAASGAGGSPAVMPVGTPLRDNLSTRGVPAATPPGAGDVAMSRAAAAGTGASAGSAWASGRNAPADVVARAAADAAGTATTPLAAGFRAEAAASAYRPGVRFAVPGAAAQVADAATPVVGLSPDTPASGLGRGGIGAGAAGTGTGATGHGMAPDALAGKPVEAAPALAAGMAPPAAPDSTGRHGRVGAAPVGPAVSVATPDVTTRVADVGQGGVSGLPLPPATAVGAVPAAAGAASTVLRGSDAVTLLGSTAGPARDTGGGAAAVVSPAASEPARPVAASSAQAAAPVIGAVAEVAAAPVMTPATVAGRPASGFAAQAGVPADAPVATPADVAAQVAPGQFAVPVMTPVTVEDFGAASGVVSQSSSLPGVSGSAAGSGRPAATADGSAGRTAPRSATGDRPMQWLPAIDGVGAVSAHASAAAAGPSTGAVTSGAAPRGGSAASAAGMAAVPAPDTKQVAGATASDGMPGRSPEPVSADAGAAGMPAADHKVAPHAVAAQSDPVPAAVSVALPEQAIPVSVPSTPSVDAPAAAAAPAAPPVRVPEPAEQVGPALLTLAKTPEGAQEMTVRMQPAELGMVQVRVTRTVSGATQIDITAEKTSTLLALQRDQPQLHRTLDEAGLSAVGRTITIHAAPAAQVASGDGAPGLGGGQPGGQQAGGQQAQGGRGNAGSADTDGGGGGDRGGFSGREANSYAGGRRSGVGPGHVAANANNASRSGLDITA